MTFNWTLVIIAILTCVDSYSARSLKNYKGHEKDTIKLLDPRKYISTYRLKSEEVRHESLCLWIHDFEHLGRVRKGRHPN